MVEEKGKSKSKKKTEKKKKSFLDLLLGKPVVIQSRFGIIYEGTFSAKEGDYYILTQAKIMGRNRIAYVDLVGIKRETIAHIHVEPKKIEEIEK